MNKPGKITKEELLIELKKIIDRQDEVGISFGDQEQDHIEADLLLIRYINDQDISYLYNSIGKWYA